MQKLHYAGLQPRSRTFKKTMCNVLHLVISAYVCVLLMYDCTWRWGHALHRFRGCQPSVQRQIRRPCMILQNTRNFLRHAVMIASNTYMRLSHCTTSCFGKMGRCFHGLSEIGVHKCHGRCPNAIWKEHECILRIFEYFSVRLDDSMSMHRSIIALSHW